MTANPYMLYPFAEAGDTAAISNTGPNTGTMSYQAGFTPNYELNLATDPSAIPIPRNQMNQLFLDITTAIQQQQTQGFALWVAPGSGGPATYPILATVAYDAGSGIQIWQSTVGFNMSVPGVDANWTNISGGAGLTINIQVLTATGTYTPSAGMAFIQARMVGGGAGGGGALGGVGVAASPGGGAGSYSEGYFTAAQIGVSKAVTIGAGGAGSSAGNGASGGTTSLGVLMTALGGSGGVVANSATSFCLPLAGGVGGAVGAGGYLNVKGQNGGLSISNNDSNVALAGIGGNSPFGTGGTAAANSVTGNPGTGYGSGGSGASTILSSGSVLSGAGAPGVVIITEYCY